MEWRRRERRVRLPRRKVGDLEAYVIFLITILCLVVRRGSCSIALWRTRCGILRSIAPLRTPLVVLCRLNHRNQRRSCHGECQRTLHHNCPDMRPPPSLLPSSSLPSHPPLPLSVLPSLSSFSASSYTCSVDVRDPSLCGSTLVTFAHQSAPAGCCDGKNMVLILDFRLV